MGGRDHFLVAERITWDFRGLSEDGNNWGNNFLFIPEAKRTRVTDSTKSSDLRLSLRYTVPAPDIICKDSGHHLKTLTF